VCDNNQDRHVLCPQCDLLVELPQLTVGHKANCPRCHTTLTACWYEPAKMPLGLAVSALLMLLLANLFPFVYMNVSGIHSEISLIQIPRALMSDDYLSVATLFMVVVQLLPAIGMASIIVLCGPLRLPRFWRVVVARTLFQLKSWCMVEIFLAGVLVSFVKLISYGNVGIGAGFIPYVLFCLLQLRAFQCTDRFWLWKQITDDIPMTSGVQVGRSGLSQGLRSCHCCMAILPVDQKKCLRCGSPGNARRPHSLQCTMALLVTSLILYIPANVLPIMITRFLGSELTSTIITGVALLWHKGSYPIAAVIFIASIMVPCLKMIAISWLCWNSTRSQSLDRERVHFIYEVVEFVGRWSMIDVFVIAVLSALVRMGNLMSIYPDMGALLFAAVVILTMLAAITFDPRLIWDRLEQDKGEGQLNG
jgi:paraquat-inducible protein A